MRRVMAGLAGLLFVGDAMGADYLRGSTYEGAAAGYNWAGVYVGGQAGYAKADFSLSGGAQQLVANLARQSFLESDDVTHVSRWVAMGRRGATGSVYGGFVGYNSQWGEIVLGAELNYNTVSLAASAFDSITRSVVSDDFRYDTTVAATVSARITDYGSLRLRTGYACGWLMPYLSAGIAFGRANYARTASVGYTQPVDTLPPPTPPEQPRPVPGPWSDSKSESGTGVFTVGYAVGAGVDVGLFPGVFVRAEYEFVQLTNFGGISANVSNFRTGAAVKF